MEEEQALHHALQRARTGRERHQPVAEALAAEASALNDGLKSVGITDSLVVKGVTVLPAFLVSFFDEVEAFQPEYGRYRQRADEVKAQLASKAGA